VKLSETSNSYKVPLRVLSVTPTRDGYVMPSRRLPDKHIRLFAGKTLDEWCMIQMATNRCIARQVFVCETKAHVERLIPIAKRWGVELIVRPRDMLHPANDTGGLPTRWGVDWAMEEARDQGDWYGLTTTPFVVTPCRRPGLFDELHAYYLTEINNPDYQYGYPCVMGMVPDPVGWFWEDRGPGTPAQMVLGQTGRAEFNQLPRAYTGIMSHWIAASWAWTHFQDFVMSRAKVKGLGEYDVIPFRVEEWEDLHIDTEEQWQRAEYEFLRHFGGSGEEAEKRYLEYRKTWNQERDGGET